MLETMIDQSTVISFFDAHAGTWDCSTKRHSPAIGMICDLAEIRCGCHVLDVACGNGVMFPAYCEREVASITGIDISPRMIDQARRMHDDRRITLVNEDIDRAAFRRTFDRVMVFNALPHFPSPGRLVATLARWTAFDGRLTIAHDIGRDRLNAIHSAKAGKVSMALLQSDELAKLFAPFFEVDVVISDERMYVVSGVRRP
ncbi:MAG: class I SAM-dependent methyltransferase [Sphaerochaetaceae bacterium]|jgi:demethylmenaquinone methyltransferase/2-methoxy-6-polyprenyl-1,4-benzoquinol methylase